MTNNRLELAREGLQNTDNCQEVTHFLGENPCICIQKTMQNIKAATAVIYHDKYTIQMSEIESISGGFFLVFQLLKRFYCVNPNSSEGL